MKYALSLIVPLALFFAGCSGSPRLQVNPEWKKAPGHYMVAITEPYVLNEDDVSDDFPGYAGHFSDWLKIELAKKLKDETGIGPDSVVLINNEDFLLTPLPLGEKKSIRVPLPDASKTTGLKRIVISMHPLQYFRDRHACFNQGGCLNNIYLAGPGVYSIVDMNETKVLAYGIFGATSSFTLAMTKGNWEDVVEDIAGQLVKSTPLDR